MASYSNSNSSSNTNKPSGTVTTNTSYGGNYLTIDLNKDYKSVYDAAVKAGDYATAAKAEAERNAKLIYLGRANEVTYNYVQPYTQSVGAGGAGTNNAGGAVYANSFNSIADAPSNWTTININGVNYKKDSSGRIYQETGANANGKTYTLVGDGFNTGTKEFTFSNPKDAREEAYRQYITSGGNKNVSKEYALSNLIDKNYIDALLSGTAGEYNSGVVAQAKAKQDEEKARLAALVAKYADVDNSFESDFENYEISIAPVVGSDTAVPTAEVAEDPYKEYIRRLMYNENKSVY